MVCPNELSNSEENAISKKSRPLKISRNRTENQTTKNSKTQTKSGFHKGQRSTINPSQDL